jgi:hypothetical protein
MNKLLSTTLVSVFLAASSASLAFAQAAPGADSRPAASQGKRYAERAFARPTERVEARLAYLRTALKISDAQQPQWDAYARYARDSAQEMEQRFKSRQAARPGPDARRRLNAIERMERRQSFHAAAVTRINTLLAVEKPLYAALSPEQKKVADVVLNPRAKSKRGQFRGRHQGYGRS